ncbi:MAG: hypothetical protein WD274_03505 [Acidimicrobiia bacterium]
MPTPPSRVSTRGHRFRELQALDPDNITVPDLGPCPLGGDWAPSVAAYWESLWSLPHSAEWTESDIAELRSSLLVLKERLARLPAAGLPADKEARLHVTISAELRLLAAKFMLSPLDRLRGRIVIASPAEKPSLRVQGVRTSLPVKEADGEPWTEEWLEARGLGS